MVPLPACPGQSFVPSKISTQQSQLFRCMDRLKLCYRPHSGQVWQLGVFVWTSAPAHYPGVFFTISFFSRCQQEISVSSQSQHNDQSNVPESL